MCPYGDVFAGNACVGADFDGDPMFDPSKDFPRDVGSTKSCEGGYTGVFDMSGNIAEWEGSCSNTTGKTDPCLIRGGAYYQLEGELMCLSTDMPTRETAAIAIGFRRPATHRRASAGVCPVLRASNRQMPARCSRSRQGFGDG